MKLELTLRIIEAIELALPSSNPIVVRATLQPLKTSDERTTAVVEQKNPVWNQTVRFISESPKHEGIVLELFTQRGDEFVRAGRRNAIFIRDTQLASLRSRTSFQSYHTVI
jgi:hypothetical protein